MSEHRSRISRAATVEAWALLLFVLLTWWFLKTGVFESILQTSASVAEVSSHLAGLMYSVFATVPLAVGAFLALAHAVPAWQIALWGGLGSGLADLVLAEGVRSPLMNAVLSAVFGQKRLEALARRSPRGIWRYISALFGAFLIAIPLPTDEEGVLLMGASRLRAWQLFILTFAADFVGIYLLVSAAQALF